jgi:hypothetical protein
MAQLETGDTARPRRRADTSATALTGTFMDTAEVAEMARSSRAHRHARGARTTAAGRVSASAHHDRQRTPRARGSPRDARDPPTRPRPRPTGLRPSTRHLEQLLGAIPTDRDQRRAWRQAASAVEHYRQRWNTADTSRLLDPLPPDIAVEQRRDHERASEAANAYLAQRGRRRPRARSILDAALDR